MSRRRAYTLLLFTSAVVASLVVAVATVVVAQRRSPAQSSSGSSTRPIHKEAKPIQKKTLPLAPPATLKAPQRLLISRIGVDAAIHPVGLTAENDMAAPEGNQEIGWYKFGATPGHPGNAVLAGHLGFAHDRGVFWRLDDLRAGDLIEVTDDKKRAKFAVTTVEQYNPVTAPREKIFGETSEARLVLITCAGDWRQQEEDYTERLVVFARPIP